VVLFVIDDSNIKQNHTLK